MRTSLLKSLLEEPPRLSPQQLDDLRAAADVLHQRANAMSAFDKAIEGAGCPHCNSFKFTKNGFSRGLQRYRCNACSRTFNAATNTPLSRLRSKEQLFQQGECPDERTNHSSRSTGDGCGCKHRISQTASLP